MTYGKDKKKETPPAGNYKTPGAPKYYAEYKDIVKLEDR